MLGTAPRPNHPARPLDCADVDPATWRFRANVPMDAPLPKPPASQPFLDAFLDAPNSDEHDEASTAGLFGWFKKAEQRVQVAPRKEVYAFDPMFMTDPNIYKFERDGQPIPRRFFKQTRQNKPSSGEVRYDRLGSVGKTANGDNAISIYTIEWEKHSGGVLDFEMFDKHMNLIVVGYCKQTDYGGHFKWVAAVTKLHGMDIPADQGPRLFSYPLYGALASGVAFGTWYENQEIQRAFPNMGAGVPRDDESELRNAMDRNARIRARRRANIPTAQTKIASALADGVAGLQVADKPSATGIAPPPAAAKPKAAPTAPATLVEAVAPDSDRDPRGARIASIAQVAERNTDAKEQSEFVRYNPEGKAKGAGMHVTPAGRGVALGAIYPIRSPIDIRADGLCITSMRMVETPVKFTTDSSLKGVSRYEAELYADEVREPVGTLVVLPEAYTTATGALALRHHTTKLKTGSQWNIPGAETIKVTDADVETVATAKPAWDPRLVETIEATMWSLRMQDHSAMASGVQP